MSPSSTDQREAGPALPERGAEVDPTCAPVGLREHQVIYCRDNLEVLRSLPDDCAELVYLDPPFLTGRQRVGRCRRSGRPQSFDDRFDSIVDYIALMRPRCEELARLLSPSGSLYYHCDWHVSHHVKVMLDEVLGERSFLNEIVWVYRTGGRATRHFARKHDVLLLYAPGAASRTHTFDATAAAVPRGRCEACGAAKSSWNHMKKVVDSDGRVRRTIRSGGRVYSYYDDEPTPCSDVWFIPHLQQKDPERVGWPTQKPLALLDRIIRVSSPVGGLVLDPCCGSGTTLVAAQQAGRRWLGIDRSPEACRTAARRLQKSCGVELREREWQVQDGTTAFIHESQGTCDPL